VSAAVAVQAVFDAGGELLASVMERVEERMAELDALPFSKFTAAYAPEVQQWWDIYGPSNWGATTPDTSAYVGLYNANDLFTGGDSKRAILPGGLGCITHKLVEVLQPKYQERMLDEATVLAAVQEKDSVNVTYLREGKLTTVSAKVVLMCTPKHITSRIVQGLPAEQRTASSRPRRYRCRKRAQGTRPKRVGSA